MRIRIMVAFFGQHNCRIDDKGRLVFPSAFKKVMPAGCDMRFVIKKSLFEPCLEMFTYAEWEKNAAEVLESLDINFNKSHAIFWREYMRDCDIVEPDPKLGRISISRKLLDIIGVDKEVVFSGNGFKIEIWAAEKEPESVKSTEEILAIAETVRKK